MTSEELILLLDQLQTQLPKCAIQVLLRLVAKCIAGGTNQVEISAADIARELGMSEDTVKVAKRALDGIVTTAGGNGNPTVWTLPVEWFVVQRSLFAVNSPVDNWAERPGNNGAAPWKPGQSPSWKPGHSALETRATTGVTRAPWTSFQGARTLETRAHEPENRNLDPSDALETRAPSIDRIEHCDVHVPVVSIRDSIDGVNWLPEDLRQDGEQLKRWLRFYFAQTRPQQPVPDGPDEIIQAKCLAITGLARLQHVLSQLHKKGTRPGDTWAWFVTVFCQRVHGTKDTTQVVAPPAFRQSKKTPSSERRPEFVNDLIADVTGATGRMN